MTVAKPENSSLNAIVLAGGDGTRLTCLTRKITGLETPKQFCPIIGTATLFDQTRRRVSIVVPPGETVTVLVSRTNDSSSPLCATLPKETSSFSLETAEQPWRSCTHFSDSSDKVEEAPSRSFLAITM
jgi:mannose-1-phosphate guanylyltransferase